MHHNTPYAHALQPSTLPQPPPATLSNHRLYPNRPRPQTSETHLHNTPPYRQAPTPNYADISPMD